MTIPLIANTTTIGNWVNETNQIINIINALTDGVLTVNGSLIFTNSQFSLAVASMNVSNNMVLTGTGNTLFLQQSGAVINGSVYITGTQANTLYVSKSAVVSTNLSIGRYISGATGILNIAGGALISSDVTMQGNVAVNKVLTVGSSFLKQNGTIILNAPVLGGTAQIAFQQAGANLYTITQNNQSSNLSIFNSNTGVSPLIIQNDSTITFANVVYATNGTTGKQIVNYSQFDSLLTQNGLQRFPSGAILQWGVGSSAANGIANITFPTPFATGLFSATGNPNGIGSGLFTVEIQGATLTNMTITCANSVTGAPVSALFTWMGIGK